MLRFLPILITGIYFKDRNQTHRTVYYISGSVVCKIVFCYESSDIPDNAIRKTRRKRGRRRGRTQPIAKRYVFQSNATSESNLFLIKFIPMIILSGFWFLSCLSSLVFLSIIGFEKLSINNRVLRLYGQPHLMDHETKEVHLSVPLSALKVSEFDSGNLKWIYFYHLSSVALLSDQHV